MQDDDSKIISLLIEIRDDQRERVRLLRDQAERSIELRKINNELRGKTNAQLKTGDDLARESVEQTNRAIGLLKKSIVSQRRLTATVLIAGFVILYFILRKP